MRLGLRMGLNSRQGGGGDLPSLDLAFALDKTLTARKGPTPAFTRSSTATFVGSNGLIQSAAINVPRFDYDPATGASKGLLIEESRTNLLLRSEEFDSGSWAGAGTNITVTPDTVIAPNGILTADKLTVGATTTTYLVSQTTPAFVSGTTYTLSCFLKADQVTRVALYTGSTATFPANAIFDLTGSGSVVENSFGTASIVQYLNGWYRCQITGTAGASVPSSIRISPVTGTSLNYPGNSVDSFYAWGAQLEAGAFPLSYIPTTIGTAARSADVCSIVGDAFSSFYNQGEGTLFADATPQTVSQISAVLYVGDGGSQFQNGIYKSNSLLTAAGLRWGATTVSTGFVSQSTIVTATDVATSRSKLAYGFKLDDFGFAYAGTLVGTDSSGTLPATNPTQMGIGNRNGALQINGHIARIQYFRKRLSNAKLQTLTAP